MYFHFVEYSAPLSPRTYWTQFHWYPYCIGRKGNCMSQWRTTKMLLPHGSLLWYSFYRSSWSVVLVHVLVDHNIKCLLGTPTPSYFTRRPKWGWCISSEAMKWFEFVWKHCWWNIKHKYADTENAGSDVVLHADLFACGGEMFGIDANVWPSSHHQITGQIFDSSLIVIYEQDAATKAHMPWHVRCDQSEVALRPATLRWYDGRGPFY